MEFRVDPIRLEDIDLSDTFFRITTPQDKPPIAESVSRLGLICPVAVKQTHDQFVVVSGFRRVDACRQNNRSRIPCRIIPDTISTVTCAEMAITDNLTQRSLNFVEQARCIELLTTATGAISSARRVAERLGLAFNRALVDKLKTISCAPQIVQDGLIKGTLSLPVVLAMSDLPEEDVRTLAQLFEMVPMGLNKQREIFLNLKEIAIREDMTIRQILEGDSLKDILLDDTSDGNQKAFQIRQYLKKRRFPRIVETEEAFKNCVRGLELGGEIQVAPPPGFEGSVCTMTIRFNNLESLKRAHHNITSAIKNPLIEDLFD